MGRGARCPAWVGLGWRMVPGVDVGGRCGVRWSGGRTGNQVASLSEEEIAAAVVVVVVVEGQVELSTTASGVGGGGSVDHENNWLR